VSRAAEENALEKQIERERDKLDKALKKLKKQVFNCEEDAQQALKRFDKQWKLHRVSGEIVSRERYASAGRPTPASETVTEWTIAATVTKDETIIAQKKQPLGKYIITTNELDNEKISADELLTIYKDQNTSVERGFRFLKDPMFFAHSLFLKKPSRIMALLMLVGDRAMLNRPLIRTYLQQQRLFVGPWTPPDIRDLMGTISQDELLDAPLDHRPQSHRDGDPAPYYGVMREYELVTGDQHIVDHMNDTVAGFNIRDYHNRFTVIEIHLAIHNIYINRSSVDGGSIKRCGTTHNVCRGNTTRDDVVC